MTNEPRERRRDMANLPTKEDLWDVRDSLSEQMREGFREINGRVRKNSEDIAVLKAESEKNEREQRRKSSKTGATAGTVVATAIVAIVEIIRQLAQKP